MRLELFGLIDATIDLLQLQHPSYQYVENKVKDCFHELLKQTGLDYITIESRIKSEASLKEKIIRNKYYLNCNSAHDVLDLLPDLIGVTVQCRFISEENRIYHALLPFFNIDKEEFNPCQLDPNLHLNCKTMQPQQQRNGFTIYRIDGYYLFNDHRINFELQIKSLVHRFWSDIEHQVVYKNTQFLYNDSFMKQVLSSVHDSLEVVDHQLQIISRQMLVESQDNRDFGMSEKGFKMFLAKSISDLYTLKMVDSLGFTTDFKKCGAILSQYIYIHDFVSSENPSMRMLEYFEHFNLLKFCEIDFTEPISLEQDYQHPDPFCDLLGKYWQSIINIDYEWHVFFVMLFVIEPGNNIQDFTRFITVIKGLLVNRIWFENKFIMLHEIEAQQLRDSLMTEVAKAMVKVGKVEIIHEDKLLQILDLFHDYVEDLESAMLNDMSILNEREQILHTLNDKVTALF